MKYSMPLPGSPIDWMMPASVSAMRGVGLPSLGSRQMVLATRPPSRLRSMTSLYSQEKAPDAGVHRILQGDVADLYGEVYHPTASCMLNTGPSRQTRRSTRCPSTSKVRMQT